MLHVRFAFFSLREKKNSRLCCRRFYLHNLPHQRLSTYACRYLGFTRRMEPQETIISTPGKGGKHAFLTLRAESPESITQDQSDANRTPAERVLSTVSWPAGVGQEEMSHWLGDFLPRHATDTEWVREGLGPNRAEEARTYLAYLRHQSDWLRAIERSRPSLPRQDGDGLGERQKGGVGNASIALVVDSLVGAVEEALRAATGELESKEDFEGTRLLATARRWRRR